MEKSQLLFRIETMDLRETERGGGIFKAKSPKQKSGSKTTSESRGRFLHFRSYSNKKAYNEMHSAQYTEEETKLPKTMLSKYCAM